MNFANKISTFRVLSVPFFIASLVYYVPGKEYLRWLALGIFVMAVVSDAVDGYIARKSKQKSEAGMILDPLADKLLLMSAFICLGLKRGLLIRFPLWVMLIVISRDVIILIGVFVIYMVKQHINISPTMWGKLTTVFQMLAVIAILIQLRISFMVWWLAIIFTVISGIDYIKRGFKTLYVLDNPRHLN
ncbi:MAG: CDP-diacylglycerol--glycerol-3-phosphate 3-phosphatidyltransferase [Candidatus Omnitrophica bacterium]|nr:CDP-diacylglycerol--glycerol-3-phosphate 3-phosphatidyltransferase [Candidatus Omnitrophota bacterium]